MLRRTIVRLNSSNGGPTIRLPPRAMLFRTLAGLRETQPTSLDHTALDVSSHRRGVAGSERIAEPLARA
jgi:hypothetical protein